jgi:glycosyltransferase involved in cell wall biosynthesis
LKPILSISPLVSVALCTYNGAAWLHQQLDLITRQTWSNIELVIVDDCSADETVQMIQSYAAKDERIRFYQNEVNLGFNKNFEKALLLCKGKWIAVADQDDIWQLNKIETMLSQWNGKATLLHCSSKKFQGTEEINKSSKPSTIGFSGYSVAAIAAKNTVEGHNIILDRFLLQQAVPFPENVFYDWWLGAVAAANGGVQWINEILVWRRIHEQNTYEKKIAPVLDEKVIWRSHLSAFLSINNLQKADKQFIEKCLQLLNTNASTDEWKAFIVKKRDIFFYYKKGLFSFFSKWKHSNKLAKKMAGNI